LNFWFHIYIQCFLIVSSAAICKQILNVTHSRQSSSEQNDLRLELETAFDRAQGLVVVQVAEYHLGLRDLEHIGRGFCV